MRAAKASGEVIVIVQGQRPIQREMAAAEVHRYRLPLTAGEYVRVAVEQQGADVFLVLFGPDRRKLTVVDSPGGGEGPERVSAVSGEGGTYRLEVHRGEPGATPGRYELRVEERRPATAEDRRRVAAEWAFHRGEGLRRAKAYGEAIAPYQQALELWRELEERESEGVALYRIGWMHAETGDPRAALPFYARSLEILRPLGDRRTLAPLLRRTGAAHEARREVDAALTAYREALELFEQEGDLKGQAFTLNDLANLQERAGESWQALESYRRALALSPKQATILGNVGDLLVSLGRFAEALDSLSTALEQVGEDDREPRAVLLDGLGKVHNRRGEPEQARQYLEQALPLWRELKKPREVAISLQRLSTALAESGDAEGALHRNRESLGLFRRAKDRQGEATALARMGWLDGEMGRPAQALGWYRQALPLAEQAGDRSLRASTLYAQGRALRDLDRLEEARASVEAALDLVEDLRQDSESPVLQASYYATRQTYFDLAIDVHVRLAEQGPASRRAEHVADAMRVSERKRARGLLEALSTGRASLRAGLAPALFAQLDELAHRLNALEEERHELQISGAPAEEVKVVERDLRTAVQERDLLRTRIARESPDYADLAAPQPLDLAEIQREVLDPRTLLLVYSLGEERSFLFLVPHAGDVLSFALPGRSRIEGLVRDLHSSWSGRSRQAGRRGARLAAELSEILLGPVGDQIGDQRLAIVADGALQYLPFAALPEPGATGSPLVVRHEVVHLPSASVLATLRRRGRGRRPAEGIVAVVADPVFDSADPRVRAGSDPEVRLARQEQGSDLLRSARDLGLRGFKRLPHSRREAEAILSLTPAGRNLAALDFAASRETVLAGRLAGYRYLHFATHGLLHARLPDLSGLVLSRVDAEGRPVEGFLRAHEIYDLDLPADLVVLSACQTGLGKEIRGEGVLGLTRAFLYAGADRVVVSLWNVGDASTAELMIRLYRGILRDGLTPAAALRAAQVSMLAEERWARVHDWAGFIFQGEWR